VVVAPLKFAELRLQATLTGKGAAEKVSVECRPGCEAMTEGNLPEDGGGVPSHVKDDLVVGAGVLGLMGGAVVGGDGRAKAEASEIALEGKSPVLELVLVTREDRD
jgi:hypothetical protein